MKQTATSHQHRKVPLRKCIGCLEIKEKRDLVRVVRTIVECGEPKFSIDTTGKMSGRGAYICNNQECFEMARKKRGFERSFKQAIPHEIYELLGTQQPAKANEAGAD